jgi:hypothetical protein
VRALLLVRITRVRREGMIEGLAIDVLGVRRKVRLYRSRQIAIGSVWYGRHLPNPARARRAPRSSAEKAAAIVRAA